MIRSRPDELTLAQMMCSRVCHDLAGPLSAVQATVELMLGEGEESSGSDRNDAWTVLQKSIRQAGVRLAFFRQIFGTGGGPESVLTVRDVRDHAAAMMPTGKVRFSFNVHADDGAPLTELPTRVGNLALILGMVGAEALPRGGAVALYVARLADGIGLAMKAEGQGAAVHDTVSGVLNGNADVEVTARNVHAYLATLLAARLSAELELSQENDAVGLATLVPT